MKASIPKLRSGDSPFPRPRLRGSDLVRPLRNQEALAAEADEQNAGHIVAYGAHVSAREFYVYSVLTPERATLCVARWDKRHPWRIAYLRGGNWLPVRTETVAAVNEWYQQARATRSCGWRGSRRVVRL